MRTKKKEEFFSFLPKKEHTFEGAGWNGLRTGLAAAGGAPNFAGGSGRTWPSASCKGRRKQMSLVVLVLYILI